MANKFIENGTGLKPIKHDELICRDCKYRNSQSIIRCAKYERKPLSVFKSELCLLYKKV